MNKNLKYALRTSVTFLSWVPVIYVFNEHVCFVSRIQGSSMSPTLNPSDSPSSLTSHDYVLLWKFMARHDLKEGDVVLLRSPIDPQRIYAKRVKAVQGDLVRTRFPYPKNQVLIPRNHIWCEGDNVHSIDSNNFGAVSSGLVLGKAKWIIWPLHRFGPISSNGGRECREANLRLVE